MEVNRWNPIARWDVQLATEADRAERQHTVDPDISRRQRFEEITEEVFEPMQRYLKRRTGTDRAEDVLSDVLLTLWRRIDVIPADQVLSWSYGVARRILANHRRSDRRHVRLVERLRAEPALERAPDPADGGPDPELMEALNTLSPEDREVLRLWAWEQLEPREIAVVLNVTVNAATLRLSRARKRLGENLARQNSMSFGHESVEGTQWKQ